MLHPTFPNLELLAYIAEQTLNTKFSDKVKKFKEINRYFYPAFQSIVFPQTWSNTATAFDVTASGTPTIAGQALTTAYTVVMHEPVMDLYMVFVDNRLCYAVDEPNEKFLSDLSQHNLLCLSKALKEY